jgi:hypothetical protein
MPKVLTLYNHSARPTVSRQISTSSGSTSTGRRHITFDTNRIDVPEAGSSTHTAHDDWINIDGHHDHDIQVNDLQPSTELRGEIKDLPGIQVVAKPRAKRYQNSVCQILISIVICQLTRLISGCPTCNLDEIQG